MYKQLKLIFTGSTGQLQSVNKSRLIRAASSHQLTELYLGLLSRKERLYETTESCDLFHYVSITRQLPLTSL